MMVRMAGSGTINTPSGWSVLLGATVVVAGITVAAFYKTRGSGDTTYLVNGGTGTSSWWALTYSIHPLAGQTLTPVATTTSGNGGANLNCPVPAATVTYDTDDVFYGVFCTDNNVHGPTINFQNNVSYNLPNGNGDIVFLCGYLLPNAKRCLGSTSVPAVTWGWQSNASQNYTIAVVLSDAGTSFPSAKNVEIARPAHTNISLITMKAKPARGRGIVKRLGYIVATNYQPFVVKQLSAGKSYIGRQSARALRKTFGGGVKLQ